MPNLYFSTGQILIRLTSMVLDILISYTIIFYLNMLKQLYSFLALHKSNIIKDIGNDILKLYS